MRLWNKPESLMLFSTRMAISRVLYMVYRSLLKISSTFRALIQHSAMSAVPSTLPAQIVFWYKHSRIWVRLSSQRQIYLKAFWYEILTYTASSYHADQRCSGVKRRIRSGVLPSILCVLISPPADRLAAREPFWLSRDLCSAGEQILAALFVSQVI